MKQQKITHPITRILLFLAIITISSMLNGQLQASNPEVAEAAIAAPTANAATTITKSSFFASWNSVPGATSYKIYVSRRIKVGFNYVWMIVTEYSGKSIGGNNTTVTGLSSGSYYQYYVTAMQLSSESAQSNEIQLLTLCEEPETTAATNVTPVSLTANWSAVTGATSYKFYMIDANENYIYNGFTVSENSLNILGLTANKLYRYRVSAVNATGESGKSGYISVTTLAAEPPVASSATSITATTFSANWAAKAGATSYLLRVVDDETQQFVLLDVETTGTSYNVTGLTPSRGYRYALKAKYGSNVSVISNWINVTTAIGDPPVATGASNITSSSFHANWNARAGATSYLLRIVDQVTQGWIELDKVVTGTSYSVTNLTPNRQYSYSLKAKYGDVVTGIGNWIYATTSNTPVVTYTLSYSSSPALAGTLSGGGTFATGTSVTAHAAPSAGYSFENWTENGAVVSTSASYAFTINSNRTLVANFKLLTGINDREKLSSFIFPNPATDMITLTSLTKGSSIKLVTLSGSLVYSSISEKDNETIDIRTLRKGLYFVVVENDNERVTGKLMIE